MAARLKIADTKAGRIFRGLFGYDNGTFERDVSFAIEEWLMEKDWYHLGKKVFRSLEGKLNAGQGSVGPMV